MALCAGCNESRDDERARFDGGEGGGSDAGPVGGDAAVAAEAGPGSPEGDTGVHAGDTAERDAAAPPLPAGCDLFAELSLSPSLVETGQRVAAGAEPTICWKVVDSGAPLPGADGWDLIIRRRDTPVDAGADASEWSVIRGIPPEERRIRYGACPPEAVGCFPAEELRAGSHVMAIWDGTRVDGLGGAVTFTVE